MNTKFILRLILAIIFSLVAFIFSELAPEIPPISQILVRIFITIWAGLLGFSIFPEIAQKISTFVVSFINTLTSKVTTEIMNHLVKLPQQRSLHVPLSHQVPLGGVSANQPFLVDTSVLIDGRILDITKTGFVSGLLLIPSFILTELQQVADSPDYLKRSRARRGFEIVEELKKVKGVRIEIWEKESGGRSVDDKLLKLTKSLGGKLLTTDFNLNKVASVSGIKVLNINELANSVKTVAIPGESLSIKIIHIGKDPEQGIGYLNDGTMVVVEKGANLVGKEIKVEVTRMIQVAAGRMIFTKQTLA